MNIKDTKYAIMFADIADSSKLYDMIGDTPAQDYIAKCFVIMTNVTEKNGGFVIKTIGDEIMSRFSKADDAFQAACKIQEGFKGFSTECGRRIFVRIGFHYGPAILENDDLFGDAVNVAARMVSIAKAKQIITTEDTINCLSHDNKLSTRRFDRVTVKGKEEKITIYEVLWEWEGLTLMGTADLPNQTLATFLALTYESLEKYIASGSPPFMMGRDPRCDLIIKSNMASRIHASIEYRREKFVLIDQSTNGTYIRFSDGRDIYLRREELPLWGEGVISLGESLDKQNEHLIQFKCPLS